MKSYLVGLMLVAAVLAAPQGEFDEEGTWEVDGTSATDHAQTIGNVLSKLPDLIRKTGAWIRGLAPIADEIHPDVGGVIRDGADYVDQAADNVPSDVHKRVQEHLNKLINITRVVQDNVVNTTLLADLPAQVRAQVAELPNSEGLLDVIESIPSPDYVGEQIDEAINYFEPLAEAIGAQGV